MKKAQSKIWWIILGGLVAIVVTIILLVQFNKGAGKSEKGLFACAGKGGVCKTSDDCAQDGGIVTDAFSCVSPEVCCMSKGFG